MVKKIRKIHSKLPQDSVLLIDRLFAKHLINQSFIEGKIVSQLLSCFTPVSTESFKNVNKKANQYNQVPSKIKARGNLNSMKHPMKCVLSKRLHSLLFRSGHCEM